MGIMELSREKREGVRQDALVQQFLQKLSSYLFVHFQRQFPQAICIGSKLQSASADNYYLNS